MERGLGEDLGFGNLRNFNGFVIFGHLEILGGEGWSVHFSTWSSFDFRPVREFPRNFQNYRNFGNFGWEAGDTCSFPLGQVSFTGRFEPVQFSTWAKKETEEEEEEEEQQEEQEE